MNKGAGIVVAIGVWIAALVVLERHAIPRVQRLSVLAEHGVDGHTSDEWRGDYYLCFFGNAVCAIVGALVVMLLTDMYFNASRRTLTTDKLPEDEAELIRQLWGGRGQFQFGIAELLALMLAVALVCSAFMMPL